MGGELVAEVVYGRSQKAACAAGRVIGVVVQVVVEEFFGILIHPLCGGVRAMNDRAVAAGEGGSELFAVKQVCNSLTDSSELRGAAVALEHDLAVAVTGVVAVVEIAGLSQVEGSVDLVAVGQLGQEVNFAQRTKATPPRTAGWLFARRARSTPRAL